MEICFINYNGNAIRFKGHLLKVEDFSTVRFFRFRIVFVIVNGSKDQHAFGRKFDVHIVVSNVQILKGQLVFPVGEIIAIGLINLRRKREKCIYFLWVFKGIPHRNCVICRIR